MVLKVYKQKHSDNYYIESHRVFEFDNKYHLSAGVPLKKQVLSKLTQVTSSVEYVERFDKGLLDKRILSVNPDKANRHVLWYDQAMDRLIKLSEKKLKTGMYPMPAFLYLLIHDDIFVYALKTGNKRPDLNSKLHYPPIYNVLNDFNICWGNVKRDTDKDLTVEAEMSLWTSYLWNSQFNQYGIGRTKSGIVKTYPLAKKMKKFPHNELVPLDMNINDLLIKHNLI